jgi:hypothetical protein
MMGNDEHLFGPEQPEWNTTSDLAQTVGNAMGVPYERAAGPLSKVNPAINALNNFYYYFEDTQFTSYDNNGNPHYGVESRKVWWIAGSNAANTQFYSDWAEYGLHPHETITRGFIIFSGPNPFYHAPSPSGDVGAIALGLLALRSTACAIPCAAAAVTLGVGDLLISGSPNQTIYVPRENLGGYFGYP